MMTSNNTLVGNYTDNGLEMAEFQCGRIDNFVDNYANNVIRISM